MEKTQNRRNKFFRIIGSIGIAALSTYAGINIYLQDYGPAYFEIVLVLILLAAVILASFSKRERLALILGSLALTFLSIYNFLTGGFGITGIFWVFVFPPIIFYIRGSRMGIYWTVVFIGLMTSVLFGYAFIGISLPYDFFTTIMFLIIFTIVSILNFVNQYSQDNYEKIITKQNLELEEKNKALSKEDKRIGKILLEIEDKALRLEKMNQLMIGRELKMINLKKEINKLKNKKV